MPRNLILFPLFVTALTAQTPGDFRPLLANRVDEARKAVGIAAGILDERGRAVFSAGRTGGPGTPAPDGDTVFEIGSITKVFTSLVLADMAEKGEVRLDDPVAKYLPPEVKMPVFQNRQITLLDISMQVSGLPRLPGNFKPANPLDPYADYGPDKLYAFLSGYQLTRAPGEKYEYSNLAVGLLGHVLARRDGTSYEEMVRRRILAPLGMNSTSQTLNPALKERLAPGHDPALNPTPNWDLDALAGAGALRSTVNDLLRFLAANLELTGTPLQPAIRRLRASHRATGVPELEIAMGWHVFTRFGGELWWHNGGTGGYRSFIGFDPARKRAAAVLCNTSFSVDDLGAHFVDARYPAAMLPAPQPAVTLDPKLLDEYAGEYELAPGFRLRITHESARLMGQATNQPKVEIFAEKKDEFFYRVVDARLSFVRDEAGKVKSLVLHQGGRDLPGKKVAE